MNKEDISNKAADWWAKHLTGTKFDAGDDEQNGPGDFASLLATLSAAGARKSLSSEKIELFKKSLSDSILSLLSNEDNIMLTVDYGPDAYLNDALRSADIPSNLLPRKTSMWINKQGLSVKLGYNGEIEEL